MSDTKKSAASKSVEKTQKRAESKPEAQKAEAKPTTLDHPLDRSALSGPTTADLNPAFTAPTD